MQIKPNLSYWEVLKRASSFLKERDLEVATAEYLMVERLGWNKTQWVLNLHQKMPSEQCEQFSADIEAFSQGMPPQYILGHAPFLEHNFVVTQDTLIPRPETEELVMWCLENNSDLKTVQNVLDLGTGTGVIGLSLKLERPEWHVTLADISEKALEVAYQNAQKLDVEVNLIESDVFSAFLDDSGRKNEKFSIIISNPPYIAENEKNVMGRDVLAHEPHLALFADNQGLAIYQKIAENLEQMLERDGELYLEIGYQQAEAVQTIFQTALPNSRIEMRKDLSGKPRMIYLKNIKGSVQKDGNKTLSN